MTSGPYLPTTYARERPDAPAVVLARTGEQLSWHELEEKSNRIAHLFRTLGLEVGDTVALLVENHRRENSRLYKRVLRDRYWEGRCHASCSANDKLATARSRFGCGSGRGSVRPSV